MIASSQRPSAPPRAKSPRRAVLAARPPHGRSAAPPRPPASRPVTPRKTADSDRPTARGIHRPGAPPHRRSPRPARGLAQTPENAGLAGKNARIRLWHLPETRVPLRSRPAFPRSPFFLAEILRGSGGSTSGRQSSQEHVPARLQGPDGCQTKPPPGKAPGGGIRFRKREKGARPPARCQFGMMMISTLRFRARPSGVRFEATGWSSPRPIEVTR